MKNQTKHNRLIIFPAVASIALALLLACGNQTSQFETARTYIQTWLKQASADSVIIQPVYLKEMIIDDWANQGAKYQIVSVRSKADYDSVGHIPHAINIAWVDIVADSNLAKLDSSKTNIIYCYYGHASMLSATMLNLLGYKSRSLNFGMMGWNPEALVKPVWDLQADYEVETIINEAKDRYTLPIIMINQADAKDIVKEMARKYLGSEGSPVITSSAVKDIVDNWEQKKAEYQIVDVRSSSDYQAGHLPHAINIPWNTIADIENLRKLDPERATIICSENGQIGQLATTVLCLLGYRVVDMKFGMMDWNNTFVNMTDQWVEGNTYPVNKTE